MRTRTARAHAAACLIAVAAAAALAGCGSSASPGAPGTSSGSSPARTAALSPSPASSATSGNTVVSYQVSYPWHWPNDVNRRATVQHTYSVPPLPELTAVSVGEHPAQSGQPAYDRISFTFTTAFPSYQVAFTDTLTSDPSGQPVTLSGLGVLKVIFRQAQAHTAGGGTSIQSQPPAQLGLTRMTAWAEAGDYEGVLTFGIGVTWPVPHSNPQIPIRITELGETTAQGTHLYVLAIDVETANQAT
jgi:hypothetical protein